MGDIRVDTSGFEKFIKKIEGIKPQQIAIESVNTMGNLALRVVKENTPVGEYDDGRQGGELRKSWYLTPIHIEERDVSKDLKNEKDYAGYVNDGHRTVVRKDGSRGWVPGKFMLLKAIKAVERQAPKIIEAKMMKHMK